MNIKFENISKSYGDRTVLQLDSGILKSGESTGIIGPNGSGKSTFLQIIAGILPADSGKVTYGKEEGFPQDKISMVFQSPYMISTTVEKNIEYPLKLRGYSREFIDERVSELCSELNISHLRKQNAKKLSGGEMQKVALARALSFQPDLLLLDEPTANIDPATTLEIEGILKNIRVSHATTIGIVSHNIHQIERLCDNLIFMHNGRIVESGLCQEVLVSPENESTRSFIRGEIII